MYEVNRSVFLLMPLEPFWYWLQSLPDVDLDDFTLADFVADVRAPTPSAAAELLAPDMRDLQLRLSSLQRRLVLRMQDRLARERLRLDGLRARLRHPGERLRQQAQRLDDLDMRLRRAFEQQLKHQQQRLAAQNHAIAPGAVQAGPRQGQSDEGF